MITGNGLQLAKLLSGTYIPPARYLVLLSFLEKVIGHMLSNEAEGPVQPAWRRASYCAAGECVEVAQRDGVIMLRDSTQPHGSVLHYAAEEWRSFVRNVRAGEFTELSSLSEAPPAR